jgi:hypothetical protein
MNADKASESAITALQGILTVWGYFFYRNYWFICDNLRLSAVNCRYSVDMFPIN